MQFAAMLIRYLASLDPRRALLWCGFIWYAVLMGRHAPFMPGPWVNAAGIALVVGLVLTANAIPAGGTWRQLDRWSLLRFFVIPFCVSSFSSTMRDAGLVVIFPRNLADNSFAVAGVARFILLCAAVRRLSRTAA